MRPLVAVRLLTYNHENYISQCIESVLMQETNFDFVIVIGEDCSTDMTGHICIEYAKMNPDRIVLLCNSKNDIQKNSKDNFEACQKTGAKYIALLEGDDYWSDPLKLQKQVDFLEANEDFSICFTQVRVKKKNGEIVDDFITKVPGEITTIVDLARYGNYIHTPSVVFRNSMKSLPDFVLKAPAADYPLYLLLAQYGKIKYIDDQTTIYRHGVGIWSALQINKIKERWIVVLLYLINHFKFNYPILKGLVSQCEVNCKSLYLNLIKEKAPLQLIGKYIYLSTSFTPAPILFFYFELVKRLLRRNDFSLSLFQVLHLGRLRFVEKRKWNSY